MKKFCVLTTTRADYGIYYWLLKEIQQQKDMELQLVVTGTHLEEKFGSTVNEIVEDGFLISDQFRIFEDHDSETFEVNAMAKMQLSFAKALGRLKPDFAILLGDRFEMAAAALACAVSKIPIIHFYGGESTLGAIDDSLRHAITKLSYYHMTSTEEYRKRVHRLGESPQRVFNVGAMALDHFVRSELPSQKTLEAQLNWNFDDPTLLMTFHPSTLDPESPVVQIENVLRALDQVPTLKVLFTMPNVDRGRDVIAERIATWSDSNSHRARAFNSLGHHAYLGMMKLVAGVAGNSSSGIIEAPSARVPTLNIGDRQKGRVQGLTVLNSNCETSQIVVGLKKLIDPQWRKSIEGAVNPYGLGNSASTAIQILEQIERPSRLSKEFYEGLA